MFSSEATSTLEGRTLIMLRKYITEFGLHILQSKALVLYPCDLKQHAFNDQDNYHIYMIHKIPKITINPQNIQVDKEKITLSLNIQDKNNITEEQVVFCLNEKFDHSALTVKTEYPYNKLTLFKDNEVDLGIRSLVLYKSFVKKELDLEIVYIGRSFGNSGERKAYQRLASHSTLQEILSDISLNEPDKDVILSLWEFDDLRLLTSIDGISNNYQTTIEEDTKHFTEILSHENNIKQIINITEAALINYFKPTYNDKFKNNFPTSEHHTYRDYYDLDFNALCIELFPETLGARIFSKHNEYHIWEFIQYSLHLERERKNMFDIFEQKV